MVDLADVEPAIDFGPAAGGSVPVSDLNDIFAHIDRQIKAWQEYQINVPASGMLVKMMIDAWARTRREVEDMPDIRFAARAVHNAVQRYFPVAMSSSAGQALLNLHQMYGLDQALIGASYLAGVSAPQGIPGNFSGLLQDARKQVSAMEEPPRPNLRIAFERRMAALATRVERRVKEREADISRHVDELIHRVESNAAAVENEHATRQEEWDAIKDAFAEQMKLEAPAQLWADRNAEHQQAAKMARLVMLSTGVLGTAAAAGWAIGAYWLAHWLFQSAILQPPAAENAQQKAALAAAQFQASLQSFSQHNLQPTFHFELIFTSAATLIYLTIFIWWMRILVRNYTTEHHLAIDASSRSAMARTYLGLIKEGGASDADRAIILSSLFRPVTDGMVRDDGPPALTPAAVAAGVISKGGST